MKGKGDEYIINGLFVDDMMPIYSCNAMKDEFLALYKKEFNITGGTWYQDGNNIFLTNPASRSLITEA